jgi:hypothetical protein
MTVPLIEISLDDERSWPSTLLAALEKHECVLRAYEEFENKRHDDSAWGPTYVPMALRPSNPHQSERRQVLESLDLCFSAGYSLRGFHCTRLTDVEVDIIRREGMTPPDQVMLRRRIEDLRAQGLISDSNAATLCEENYAADQNRAGRIWLIFTASPLKWQSGVESLFRNWGGEALYALHDRDRKMGPLLQSIGVPRIVEAAVPLADLGSYAWIWDVLAKQFLRGRGVPVSDLDYEARIQSPIPAKNIKRILSRSDPEFETLTGCAGWVPQLV